MSDRNHFYKYLSVSEEDKRVGIYVQGAGCTVVSKRKEYPLRTHPVHHYFEWSEGRKLTSYQILYIISGEGTFESEASAKQKILAGDLFILFPEIWHRFSPDQNTGWSEYWIEFNGSIIDHLLKERLLDPRRPVVSVGLEGNFMEKFLQIIDLVEEEDLTLQYSLSPLLFQILVEVISAMKFTAVENSQVEKQIKQAKLAILEKSAVNISPEKIASDLGMGYSLFRKEFKRFTGFSPIQYHIQLRIQKAKNLLITTDTAIKDIANQLGFESSNYFTRLFKQKAGLLPTEFREKNKR
jgi:AraC-like DNA-binding protein